MATKKKIAHPKRAPKRSPKTRTEKALSEMSNAEAIVGALRLVGRPDASIASELRREAKEHLDAAEALAPEQPLPEGKPSEEAYKAATRHVISLVGELLVKATDQLSEEIAAIAGSGGGDDDNVVDVLRTIWQSRWELGITGDDVSIDTRAPEHVVDFALGRINAEPAKVSA